MSRHKEAYVISYHGALCHDMSYVTTSVASLLLSSVHPCIHVAHVSNSSGCFVSILSMPILCLAYLVMMLHMVYNH